MTNDQLVEKLRELLKLPSDWPPDQVWNVAQYYIVNGKTATNSADSTVDTRGIEEVMKNLGSTEAMLAAFILQMFAKYSKDMIRELIQFYKDAKESDSEEAV